MRGFCVPGTSRHLGYISEKNQQGSLPSWGLHFRLTAIVSYVLLQPETLMVLSFKKVLKKMFPGLNLWTTCLNSILYLCLSVSLFEVTRTVCSTELSRWFTDSRGLLIFKDFLGSIWIPLKLNFFLKIPAVHFLLLTGSRVCHPEHGRLQITNSTVHVFPLKTLKKVLQIEHWAIPKENDIRN